MLKAGEAFDCADTMPLGTLRGRLQRLKNLADVVDAEGYAVTLQDVLGELETLSSSGVTQAEPAQLEVWGKRLVKFDDLQSVFADD